MMTQFPISITLNYFYFEPLKMDLVLASIKSLLLRKNDAKIDELDEQIRKHENKISQLRDV